ncbi:hypothetical protein U1Q18_014869 [Sarracenia purpurea var. burkii]
MVAAGGDCCCHGCCFPACYHALLGDARHGSAVLILMCARVLALLPAPKLSIKSPGANTYCCYVKMLVVFSAAGIQLLLVLNAAAAFAAKYLHDFVPFVASQGTGNSGGKT